MGSYSDSTSGRQEELPVFDFLQPPLCAGHTETLDLGGAEEAVISSSAKGNAGACTAKADVLMISSESDDDAPYVPLAQRLKQKQDSVISTFVAATKSNAPANLVNAQLPSQIPDNLSESEPPLGFREVGTVNSDVSDVVVALHRRWLPLKHHSGVGINQTSPVKWTVEKIQASREEALKRRQAMERQKRNKDALRQEQERQKVERKALSEAAKAMRPEECIKHMVVAVDPALLQLEGGGTLLATLQALGCSCAIEKQPLPCSVSWMRKTPRAQPHDGASVPEAQVVMQITVDDIMMLIYSSVQEERNGNFVSGPSLTSWVQEQQRCIPSKTLSLVVMDLEKNFKSQKSQSQKRFGEAVAGENHGGERVKKRRKKGGAAALPVVSRVEVEEAMVHLQLHTGVSVHFLSTWKGFSDHIAMTTKAIAEAPFKQEREKTAFSFYLESEWAGGQRVDKAGTGLLQVWKRQIQQLNRVSPDMASAILAAYPSPQLLKKAYNLCKTDSEKMSLLSDILIRRGEGITSTMRRVGPELSKRFFLLINSCDPEQTLDSSC